MKHIPITDLGEVIVFPKKPRVLVKYLHDAFDHKVITSRMATDPFHSEWVLQAVADHFDVPVEDVECVETEEYTDAFQIAGRVVAYMVVS